MTNPTPAQASVEAVLKKHLRISIDQDWDGMKYAILGIDEAAAAIAALSPPPTVGAEDEASLFHVTGERITRKDLNNAYRSGQENGRLAAHMLDGVRRHHDPSCALWGDLPADCDCSLSDEPVSCIASEKGGV